jgi:hypothetical protein
VLLTIMITGVQRYDVELLAGAYRRAVLHLTDDSLRSRRHAVADFHVGQA